MALADERFEEQGRPDATTPVERAFSQAIGKHRAGDLEAATRGYGRVLGLDPFHREALNNLGVVLRAASKNKAALTAYQRALALKPDDPGLLANIGNVQRSLGRLDEALASLHKAVSLAPKAPAVHHNLGLVLSDLGHHEEALACFDRSLALWPNNTGVKLDRALALLAKGDYLNGFRALEARFEPHGPEREGAAPVWNGESLKGKSLLIETEQSAGDSLQFIRFAELVRGPAQRVVVSCPPELVRLLASARGVDRAVPFGEEPEDVDLRVPLLSLPRLLGTTSDRLPATVPYLASPPESGFTLTHPDSAKLSVGIAWTETPDGRSNELDAAGLEHFLPLLARADIAFYSLQTGPRADDLATLGAAGLVHDLCKLLDNIDDLARVLEQLDLVITVNVSIAQLAGALGRPVWLILPVGGDWRWALDRERCPWYPTLRLFRQPAVGDWDGAFEAVVRKLHALVAG